MKGYLGQILIIDLSTGISKIESIADEIYEKYLSGVGLGAYYLYNNIPQGADPLGPDNILGFTSGLLTNTPAVMSGRWMVMCKSPLTGGWGDANCGGNFSPAIKRCGFDAIFIKGISDKPIYIYIDNEEVQIKDASHLWGIDAVEAEEILIKENKKPKKPSVAVIGTAGEKLSLISGICNDGGRIAARSGVGAVMGSKNLKALVLAGSKSVKCADPTKMKQISKEYTDKVKKANLPVPGFILPTLGKFMLDTKEVSPQDGIISVGIMKKWGTGFCNTMGMYNGDDPIKNWGGSVVDYPRRKFKNMNPDIVRKKEFKKYYCRGCVIGCGGICEIDDITNGEFTHTHKPEYETVNAFGALCLNDDLNSIFYINELMNRAGMDTISGGNTVAFAIECYENGILTKEDTDGLELTWGNSKAIVSLIKKMIAREGIGDILADGVKAASEKIGTVSDKYAMHAGGQEPGMHHPLLDPNLGLHFSVEPTPGRHTVGQFSYYNYMHLWDFVTWAPPHTKKYPKSSEYKVSKENALKGIATSMAKMLLDCAGGCLFALTTGFQHWRIFDYLNASTGWNKTPDEYMLIGKRVQTIRQQFNVREGINPINFKIKDRIAGTPPFKEGPLKGRSIPIEDMMKEYWDAIGWDRETGKPTEETLAELSL